MSTELLDPTILGPPLVAGILVVATHVPLGREVLRRGIIFIDLAVAQVASLGVVAADSFGLEAGGFGVQIAAVGAALLGALLLTWTERRFPEVQEALIGGLFVLAATGGILLLANHPHGGERLKDLLVGQILWVRPATLGLLGLLYVAVLGLWFARVRRSGRAGFYLLFAVMVTASVQVVGVYLVFATLILPALATRRLPSRLGLGVGWGIGLAGYSIGILLSGLFDLPTGPVIVWALAALCAAAMAVGARRSAPDYAAATGQRPSQRQSRS